MSWLIKATGALMCVVTMILGASGCVATPRDPLSSWNDGAAKAAITDFVKRVTTEGSSDFVVPGKRIAVFDNDGTLWSEQPAYFQLLFAIDRVKQLAPEHPEWSANEPFKTVLDGDIHAIAESGEKGLGHCATWPRWAGRAGRDRCTARWPGPGSPAFADHARAVQDGADSARGG